VIRSVGVALAATLFALLSMPASAQTLRLSVRFTQSGAVSVGDVRAVSGAVGTCPGSSGSCAFFVKQGATVRIAVDYPGRLMFGTGPAVACALSTCSFTMTEDVHITASFSAGDMGPGATLTTTRAGDGAGTIAADGARCTSGVCTVTYLQGSSVEVFADAGASARFTGYSSGTGDAVPCGATPTCSFTLNGDAAVTGTFLALTSFTLTPSTALGVPGGPAQMFTATGTYTGGVSGTIPSGRGAWTAAPALPFRVENLAAVALGGRIYAMGGDTNALSPQFGSNRLVAFDPGTQVWTSLAQMLVSRARLGAAEAGGLVYAIGGSDGSPSSNSPIPVASVERYDPGTNTWTMRASMSAPREGLVAGTVNDIIYAAGGAGSGGAPLATLEAYDPASDTWTPRAPMPTPRSFAAGGVVDGILYVVGGNDGTFPSLAPTVEAYDPATNTWTTKAPLPVLLPRGAGAAAAAVVDGVLYVFAGVLYGQSAVYAYDPTADAWIAKAPMGFARSNVAAASLDGIVYAIGGYDTTALCCSIRVTTAVETFVDSLRWSSSDRAVARIDQAGVATPLAAGTATIIANVGGTTCGANCPTFIVAATEMSLDAPANNTVATVGAGFTVGGWALNRGAPTGTGVDATHVYAAPAGGGAAIFLGAAQYGGARADVAAVYGAQFTNSGFTLGNAGQALTAGTYTIIAWAHNPLTQQFDAARIATIQLQAAVSQPFIAVDTPQPSQVVTSAFEVGGWALDAGAPSGTGVEAVHFYVFPNDGASPGVFMGSGSYGLSRPDVGAIYGSRFTNAGYHFTITGLGPGAYVLGVYARSTVTGAFSIVRTLRFTVSATALMSIDTPAAEATITAPAFLVGGWSIDRTVEGTAQSGSGVDTLHLYAYPNPGSGATPIFLGIATMGISRPDVGAVYGVRYDTSGYELVVDRAALGLAPGVYNLVVHSHSTVTGSFNNVALVRVTLQ
jgi:N-acetylneuraminic acid mutarotase